MSLTISDNIAHKVSGWMRERGGIAVWHSINLSNPSKQLITPLRDSEGNSVTKPSWDMGEVPDIHKDPAQIIVETAKEVRRFHVAVRLSGNGLSLKVTDGGTRRVRSAVAKAGEGAYYAFDYSTQEAVIFVPEKARTLTQWEKTNIGG